MNKNPADQPPPKASACPRMTEEEGSQQPSTAAAELMSAGVKEAAHQRAHGCALCASIATGVGPGAGSAGASRCRADWHAGVHAGPAGQVAGNRASSQGEVSRETSTPVQGQDCTGLILAQRARRLREVLRMGGLFGWASAGGGLAYRTTMQVPQPTPGGQAHETNDRAARNSRARQRWQSVHRAGDAGHAHGHPAIWPAGADTSSVVSVQW